MKVLFIIYWIITQFWIVSWICNLFNYVNIYPKGNDYGTIIVVAHALGLVTNFVLLLIGSNYNNIKPVLDKMPVLIIVPICLLIAVSIALCFISLWFLFFTAIIFLMTLNTAIELRNEDDYWRKN